MRLLTFLFLLFAFEITAKELRTCIDYEPFHIDQQGERHWAGRNIELLFYLAEEMGLTLDTTTRAPFARCLKLLEQGQIDVLPGLVHTKERAKYASLVPYGYRKTLAIFYNLNQPIEQPLTELTGRDRIGIHSAFKLPENLENAPWHRNLVRINSTENGMQMVAKNRLSGVLATIDTGWEIISENSELMGRIGYLALPGGAEDVVYMAISKKSDKQGFSSDMALALKKLAANPSLAHLQINIADGS